MMPDQRGSGVLFNPLFFVAKCSQGRQADLVKFDIEFGKVNTKAIGHRLQSWFVHRPRILIAPLLETLRGGRLVFVHPFGGAGKFVFHGALKMDVTVASMLARSAGFDVAAPHEKYFSAKRDLNLAGKWGQENLLVCYFPAPIFLPTR